LLRYARQQSSNQTIKQYLILAPHPIQSIAHFSRNPYTFGHMKELCFSGIKPTNVIHLGNYIDKLKKWVEIQHRYP